MEQELDAGTYPWVLDRPGIDFPTVRNHRAGRLGFGVVGPYRIRPRRRGGGRCDGVLGRRQALRPSVQVAGDVCSIPGPRSTTWRQALVDIPARMPPKPIDVTIDGYAGKYIESTVPTDIKTDEQGNFVDCDPDGGTQYFESWIGDPSGWGGYCDHQGSGLGPPTLDPRGPLASAS